MKNYSLGETFINYYLIKYSCAETLHVKFYAHIRKIFELKVFKEIVHYVINPQKLPYTV